MSYSRWATTWPGGGPGWYIYHDVNGMLFVSPPHDGEYLNERDTQHLRDILNNALWDWHADVDGEPVDHKQVKSPTTQDFYEAIDGIDRLMPRFTEALRLLQLSDEAKGEETQQEVFNKSMDRMSLEWFLKDIARIAARYRDSLAQPEAQA